MNRLKALAHTTFASLAIRNFRLYYWGQAVSMSGSWMQTVALGWLALQISGSGVQLGLVVALQFLPLLFLGPYGGVIADRFDKRKTFMRAQAAFSALALLMSILVLSGVIEIWMLYVFALAFGFVKLVYEPARQTFVYEMVDSTFLKNAISLNAALNNFARVVGPSIGGFLILGVGIGFCFMANAVAQLGVIVMLRRMDIQALKQSHHGERKPGQLREGLRYAMRTPVIRNTLLMMAVIGTFALEWQVSLPLFAERTFMGGAESYAALLSALGVGAVLGGLFAASRHSIAPHHLIFYAFLFGVSMIITSLMPTLHLAVLGMVLVGFFSANQGSIANTMIQLESAPEMRGRVMSLWSMAIQGSTPIGGPIIGLIGESAGPRWGLVVGGLSAVFAAGIASIPLLARDRAREIPESMPVEVGDPDAIENK